MHITGSKPIVNECSYINSKHPILWTGTNLALAGGLGNGSDSLDGYREPFRMLTCNAIASQMPEIRNGSLFACCPSEQFLKLYHAHHGYQTYC